MRGARRGPERLQLKFPWGTAPLRSILDEKTDPWNLNAGIRPAASDVVHAHMYWPWPGFSGDFPRQDVVKALHGLTGSDFVRGYINQLHPRIASLAMPYAGLFHSPQSEFNLFTKYRSELGLVTSGVWLPDTSEADSRSAFQASSGFQQGYHLCRGAVPRMVAANLSKLEHVNEALHVSDAPLDVCMRAARSVEPLCCRQMCRIRPARCRRPSQSDPSL